MQSWYLIYQAIYNHCHYTNFFEDWQTINGIHRDSNYPSNSLQHLYVSYDSIMTANTLEDSAIERIATVGPLKTGFEALDIHNQITITEYNYWSFVGKAWVINEWQWGRKAKSIDAVGRNIRSRYFQIILTDFVLLVSLWVPSIDKKNCS